jgi:prepilin-type N-terminal cleavage/methylation domain-containing protein
MHQLSIRERRADRAEDGFTLIELVFTVAIVGIIVVALTGVVVSYLRTTVTVETRLTESHDVQFASAYWQRDVASIGRRSTTYDRPSHSFPLQQSVESPDTGSLVSCSLPSSANLVTLAWTEYAPASPDTPTKITVTYLRQGASPPYNLVRVRCSGSHVDSRVTVAKNLSAIPTVVCVRADGTSGADKCNGSGANVPVIVTMALTSHDKDSRDASSTYSATLSGERRQT